MPVEAHLPEHVSHNLVHGVLEALPARGPAILGARGSIGFNSLFRQHLLDAEHMVSIAHGNTAMKSIGAHDVGNAGGGLAGVITLRLGDDVVFRHAALDQIIAPDAAFAELRFTALATGGDDHRSNPLLEEIECVIETCAEDW